MEQVAAEYPAVAPEDVLAAVAYAASTALDEDLGGSSDATVAKACADEGRVLVTPDLHRGLLQRSLPALAAVDLQGSIAIVEPERMRTWRPGD